MADDALSDTRDCHAVPHRHDLLAPATSSAVIRGHPLKARVLQGFPLPNPLGLRWPPMTNATDLHEIAIRNRLFGLLVSDALEMCV